MNLSKENEMMTEMVADLRVKLETKDESMSQMSEENNKFKEMI